MASVWAKWTALAVLLVACVILVSAAPPSFYDEYMEPAAADQQETSVDDFDEGASALTRTRRDSIGYAQGGGGGKGWGWSPPVGPVFSYVRTDPWANFQWGVRHKVYGWGWKVIPIRLRIRRGDEHGHGGGGHHHGYAYLGPVYTYAKTDHYANFKWGVRHHVGGGHHHG